MPASTRPGAGSTNHRRFHPMKERPDLRPPSLKSLPIPQHHTSGCQEGCGVKAAASTQWAIHPASVPAGGRRSRLCAADAILDRVRPRGALLRGRGGEDELVLDRAIGPVEHERELAHVGECLRTTTTTAQSARERARSHETAQSRRRASHGRHNHSTHSDRLLLSHAPS
eukprot:121740-Prymnesium_polylepis.2